MKNINENSESIFTNDFPITNSQDELEKIQVQYSDLDPDYVASGCSNERRKYYDSMWKQFRKYADRNFLSQIKISFRERIWEMFVGVVLLQHGYDIENLGKGPDFFVNSSFYLECISVSKGDERSQFKVPEFKYNQANWISETPILLRITSAIKEKYEKYKNNWKGKDWFDQSMPFIIALNTSDLNILGSWEDNVPYIAKVLYGIGPLVYQLPVGPGTDFEQGKTFWKYREEIKKGDSDIQSTIFLTADHSEISGILYSESRLIMSPLNGDNFLLLKNDLARNPLPEKVLDFTQRFIRRKIDDQWLKYSIE